VNRPDARKCVGKGSQITVESFLKRWSRVRRKECRASIFISQSFHRKEKKKKRGLKNRSAKGEGLQTSYCKRVSDARQFPWEREGRRCGGSPRPSVGRGGRGKERSQKKTEGKKRRERRPLKPRAGTPPPSFSSLRRGSRTPRPGGKKKKRTLLRCHPVQEGRKG